ncbi:MAG TPA: MarR family transcriptional regulator [Pseudonocardiaceae bacterium]|jgi:DNA-binding MarR family transcriptional regulator
MRSDDEVMTTFGRLAEAYSQVERRLAQSLQSETGLPHAWFEVLMRLSRSPGQQLKMSTLADQIALTTGGITRLIDRMETAGYVERSPCASDRRVSYAGMTESGRQVLQQAIPVVVANLRAVFGDFGARELSTLDDLLDRLRR